VILWQKKTPAEVRNEQRPVALLIADGDEKVDNQQAWYLDTLLLEDPVCMTGLVDFSFVRIGTADLGGWPPAIAANVKKGTAVLALVTCDGNVRMSFPGTAPTTAEAVTAAAANVSKQNEQMKGKLPPAPVAKDEPKEEKKDDRKGMIPGLPPPKKKEGEEEEEPKDPKDGKDKNGKKEAKKDDSKPPKKPGGMGGPMDE
jgi:hypothetical protein